MQKHKMKGPLRSAYACTLLGYKVGRLEGHRDYCLASAACPYGLSESCRSIAKR